MGLSLEFFVLLVQLTLRLENGQAWNWMLRKAKMMVQSLVKGMFPKLSLPC